MNDIVIFAILFILGCGAIACFGDVLLRLIYREKNELRHLGAFRLVANNEGLQFLLDNKINLSDDVYNEARKYYRGLQNYGTVSERHED